MIMTSELEDIFSLYEANVVVSPQPHIPQFMLCPVGLVGAGKTTVIKPLAERMGLVRIAGDEIRKLLQEHGMSNAGLYTIASELHLKYMRLGHSIAIDTDCATPHTIDFIARCTQEFGAPAVWVHVDPPEEFILNKLQNYKHTWLFKDAEEAVQNYFSRKALHEKLRQEYVYTFDTSRADLQAQLGEAELIIEKVLHSNM